MVDLLFPFNDALLRSYHKKVFTANDKKRLFVFPLIMLLCSLLFAFIGLTVHWWRIIYIIPVVVESLCAFVLSFSQKENQNYLGLTISVLSISNFVMAVCIVLSRFEHTIAASIGTTLVSELFFLILLMVGYRIHHSYQLKHGGWYEKGHWNSVLSVVVIVVGIGLAKLLTKELIAFLCWIVWITVHLSLSEIVLEYRKFVEFSHATDNDIKQKKY